jgi:hypothetical protein
MTNPSIHHHVGLSSRLPIKGFEVMGMFKKGKKGQFAPRIDTIGGGTEAPSSTACLAFMREPPTRSGLHAPRRNFCSGTRLRIGGGSLQPHPFFCVVGGLLS